ncbi:hypothetical protein ACE41H_12535 [Paenibacillus enshidis]|uniref:Uncharacterized protein n=1 Tax=Paenibacillus enshidis TaxID=1458439 RepID=A0ABV5ATR1_9BACL
MKRNVSFVKQAPLRRKELQRMNISPSGQQDNLEIISERQYLYDLSHELHNLAHYHMKLSLIFCDHNQPLSSLILCDWALTAMLKALYIKEHNKPFPERFFSMVELLHLLHTESAPSLDVVIFIGTIQFLASNLEREEISKMKKKNVTRLLNRTDEILYLLSTRIMNNPSKRYQSIF